MTAPVPNFRRGVPPTAAPTTPAGGGPKKPAVWLAKYNGTCGYCGVTLSEGLDRVQWNEDRTTVVCSHHKVDS